MDIQQLANPAILNIKPYQPGKPIDEVQRELGIVDVIKLASNENPLGPSPMAVKAIQQQLATLELYPDGSGFYLKQKLAQMFSLNQNQITLGDGSDQVFEMIARVFVNPGEEIIIPEYGFATFSIIAKAVMAKISFAKAIDYHSSISHILDCVTKNTKLIFLANPNNPTGGFYTHSEIQSLLQKIPQNVFLVLDEAYYEYARQHENYPDSLALLSQYSNLIVTRTFSKAYGLAGLRIGYGISNMEIAGLLNRVRLPFNINNLALVGALASLDDHTHLNATLACNESGMQQFKNSFSAMGLNYLPSVGNFLTVCFPNQAEAVYNELLKQGIITRPLAAYNMLDYLRISVGTKNQNERLIEALKIILSK